MAKAHNTRSKLLFQPQENGFCLLPVHKRMLASLHLTQPLAGQAPSSPSVTGRKPGPLYPQEHFPAFPSLWHYLEESAPNPGETSEVIWSISSLTNEET